MKKYIKSTTNINSVNDLFDFLSNMYDSIDNLMDYIEVLYSLPDEVYGVDISELYKLNDSLYDIADKVVEEIIDVHTKINKME